MNFTFIHIVALALFLGSVSVQAEDSSCIDLMNAFLKKKPVVNTSENSLIKKINDTELADEVKKAIKDKLSTLEKKPSESELDSFLLFLDSLREKNQLKAIAEMDELTNPDTKAKFMRKHQKIQKIIDKERKKVVSSDGTLTPKMMNHMERYEKLAYGCRSTKWTPERKAAGASFKKFTIGIGLASSIGAYTYQNWDREFDGVWIGRLGYELTVGTLVGLIGSRIVSNPENTPMALALKRYFLSRGTGLVDMFAYGALFGISDEEARQRLTAIMEDPERKVEIEKLRKYMDEKNLYQKFKERFFEKLAEFKDSGEELNGDGKINDPISKKSIDWDDLTAEDLQNEEIQNVLLTAIMQQMYDEQKGDLIATGNAGSDRYAFHAAYGAIMLPKDTFISLYIYNTLCMGALNPKAAMIKAIGVFTLNRIIFDQVYYYIRRTSINQ